MGADVIQAQYDQLEQIAVRFGRQAESTAQTTQRMQQSMRALQAGGWEGRGAAAFFAEMDRSVLPSLQRLVAALQQSQSVTRQISQVMRAAEEEASRPFHGDSAAPGPGPAQQGGGFWGAVGDFFTGAGAELKDMATGLWGLVTDPVSAATGLWYGVTHPGELWDALKQPYVEAWENGRPWEAIGRGAVAIFTTVLGAKGADKIAKALKGATLADDAGRLASVTDDAARLSSLADDAGRIGSGATDVRRLADASDLAGKSLDEIAAANKLRFPPTFEGAEAAARVPKISQLSERYGKLSVGTEGSQALVDELAQLTSHGTGDRVVLGPWKPGNAPDYARSYVAQAKSGAGIWFETPDGMYAVLGKERTWQVNEAFLRQQLERGVPRIEYVGESIADVLRPENAGRASYKELRYLLENAEKYGYTFDPIKGVWTK